MPIFVEPSLDCFKLLAFVARWSLPCGLIQNVERNLLLFQESEKTRRTMGFIQAKFLVESKAERFEVPWTFEIVVLGNED